MSKFKAYIVTLSLLLIPHGIFAATAPRNFKGLVGMIVDIIELLILGIFALTFIVLVWGIIRKWIIGGGDEEGVSDGRQLVLAGIIALVVMSSVWGIVYIFQASLFGG